MVAHRFTAVFFPRWPADEPDYCPSDCPFMEGGDGIYGCADGCPLRDEIEGREAELADTLYEERRDMEGR